MGSAESKAMRSIGASEARVMKEKAKAYKLQGEAAIAETITPFFSQVNHSKDSYKRKYRHLLQYFTFRWPTSLLIQ